MMLAVREAGKTLNNAIAEVREAVDFCRYYANEAEHTLPQDAKAVGAIVAISPWNFRSPSLPAKSCPPWRQATPSSPNLPNKPA